MVEILIAVALLVIIFSLGLFISWDFYRGFAFLSEQRIVVSVLQKARNQAMSNINQKPHGVRVVASSCYIIFEGTYDLSGCNSTTNEVIKMAPTVTTDEFEFTFLQLSGDVLTGGNLTLTSNGRNAVISVNSNGRIDVQ